jgi:flavin-dependent dehydrogenase
MVDGQPVATGIALLADAWACTNPALGRGMTFGLLHAQQLRDSVRAHLEDPRDFAEAWDAATETKLTLWYRETVQENRVRLRQYEALRNGLEPKQPSARADALRAALLTAMPHDPDLFRAFLESRCCITPLSETLAHPRLVERILELARDRERPPIPGPNREQLLQLLN